MLSLLDFYQIAHKIVKSYPQVMENGRDIKWKRLQTWGVLHDQSQLDQDGLGMDRRDVDHWAFYSRKWERSNYKTSELGFDYPMLSCYEIDHQTHKVGTDQEFTDIRLELTFLAKMPEAIRLGSEFDPAIHYSFSEIAEQLKKFRSVFFSELMKFGRVDRYDKTGAGNNLVNVSYDNSLMESTPDPDEPDLTGWQSSDHMNSQNLDGWGFDRKIKSNLISRSWEGAVFSQAYRDDLCGCRGELTVRIHRCEQPNFTYSTTRSSQQTGVSEASN